MDGPTVTPQRGHKKRRRKGRKRSLSNKRKEVAPAGNLDASALLLRSKAPLVKTPAVVRRGTQAKRGSSDLPMSPYLPQALVKKGPRPSTSLGIGGYGGGELASESSCGEFVDKLIRNFHIEDREDSSSNRDAVLPPLHMKHRVGPRPGMVELESQVREYNIGSKARSQAPPWAGAEQNQGAARNAYVYKGNEEKVREYNYKENQHAERTDRRHATARKAIPWRGPLAFGQETQIGKGTFVTLPDEVDVELGKSILETGVRINFIDGDLDHPRQYQIGAPGFSFCDLTSSAEEDGPAPVLGPLLQLQPHNSKFKRPVVVNCDLSSFLTRLQDQALQQRRKEVAAMDLAALKKQVALELTDEQRHALHDTLAKGSDVETKGAMIEALLAVSGEEDCTILMLRQSGTNAEDPWLPMEDDERLSMDANGMATIRLHSFSYVKICGKIGKKAISWAASTVAKAVEGACKQFIKVFGYIDKIASKGLLKFTNSVVKCPAPIIDCIVKYGAMAGLAGLAAVTVTTGGVAAIAVPVSTCNSRLLLQLLYNF
eukprot:COSAG06_NODE_1353_length_9753_cov_4.072405_2_plen_544_part_00